MLIARTLEGNHTLEVDEAKRQISIDGGERKTVTGVAWVFLIYFLKNPNRLVSKEELIERTRDSRFTSDDAIYQGISRLRKELRTDDNLQIGFIETRQGHGYIFEGEVKEKQERLRTKPYSTLEENQIANLIDYWEEGTLRLQMDFYRKDPRLGKSQAQLLIEPLVEIIDAARGVPGPELLKLANCLFDTCGGCGRGAEELAILRPLLTKIWEKRITYREMIEYENDIEAQSLLLTKLEVDHRLRGNSESAETVAEYIARILQEYSSERYDSRTIDVALRIHESLSPSTIRELGLHGQIEYHFGEDSSEYFRAIKCEACKAAVTGDESYCEHYELLKQHLDDRYREATDRASLNRVKKLHRELDHVALAKIDYDSDMPEELDRNLVEFGKDRIRELYELTDNPLRKAQVGYWLYCATGRQTITLVDESLRLLSKKPLVNKLCVLDVVNLKQRLVEERNS